MRCPQEKGQHPISCLDPPYGAIAFLQFLQLRVPRMYRRTYHFVLASVKTSPRSEIALKRVCGGIEITYGHGHFESVILENCGGGKLGRGDPGVG